jgi:hypothetical protein
LRIDHDNNKNNPQQGLPLLLFIRQGHECQLKALLPLEVMQKVSYNSEITCQLQHR